MGRLYVGVARAWAYAINPWRRRLSEERFLSARPGAQETCAGKSRVAAFGMTGGWSGFMSEPFEAQGKLKLRPPEKRAASPPPLQSRGHQTRENSTVCLKETNTSSQAFP